MRHYKPTIRNIKMFDTIKLVFILNLIVIVFCAPFEEINLREDEDTKLSVPELLTKYGYANEVHTVQTWDGYILTMHRITGSRNSNTVSKNKIVFLQHGLLSSSYDWIITGPDQALGYLLADLGYDVWIGNARGNTHSRKHVHYDPDKDADFWDFSWHEIGLIDLPAMIDYALNTTGKETLMYVGHSQGTTAFYVMASMLPEYNSKIAAHFSLAPIGFMNHMTSPLMHIMAFWDGSLSLLLKMIGVHEFLPTSDFMGLIGELFCGQNSITKLLCTNALFVIAGFNPAEMNTTLLPTIMAHTPAGSSTKQFLHYSQEINSGHFRQYDYGMFENLNKYGSIHPPDYPLNKITAPVYLLYSLNDWLSAEVDVVKLYSKLGNPQGKFIMSDFKFNHLDYLIGIHAHDIVYNKLISLMSRH